MTSAIVTSRGRVTIPKIVRDKLRLKAGDRVEFDLQDDGTVLMVSATVDLADLWGFLPAPEKSVSIADVNRAIRNRPQ